MIGEKKKKKCSLHKKKNNNVRIKYSNFLFRSVEKIYLETNFIIRSSKTKVYFIVH